jgi:hypothetical protein
MAANTNKRIPIKWIRDGAKSAYDKKDRCYICDSKEELELHHTHGLTNLLEKWAKENQIPLSTDEEVLDIRDRFIEEHHREIYDEVFTLCANHHKKLHLLFGKSPALSSAQKQTLWVLKQKDKHNGIETIKPNELVHQGEQSPREYRTLGGVFSGLICNNNSFSSLRTS